MSSDIPDWEAKYWANRAAQKQREQRPQVPGHTPLTREPPAREIDATTIMQQRLLGGLATNSSTDESAKRVFLREGATYYKQIQGDGFGSAVPLVRSMGGLSNVTGKEFVFMGDYRGYCIDNLNQVDMSKVNENPDRMLSLVRVRAPFVGDILVPRTAIIEVSGPGGRQLLRG